MKKFVAVMNVPAPYRQHLFNELWRQLKDRGIDFHVHYMARGFKARPKSWMDPKIDFPHTYWHNWGTSEHQFHPGMLLHLLFHQPDWLICGSSFYTFTGIGVMALCRKSTRIAWVEGNTKTPGEMHGWRGWIKRWVMAKCKWAAVPGSDAAKYIGLHQKFTSEKMPIPVILPNLVDEKRFVAKSIGQNIAVDNDVKRAIIPARLLPVKGLLEFIGLLTPQMIQGWRIDIVGDGPLKEQILTLIDERKLGESISITPFVPYEEMPAKYSAADLLILPSIYDPNPLSVVEALHCGLPIALTSEAGNVEEAVSEGKNGWVLPVKNRGAFVAKLAEVFSAPKELLREMGQYSKRHNACFWDTEKAIREFVDEIVK